MSNLMPHSQANEQWRDEHGDDEWEDVEADVDNENDDDDEGQE